jgi:hypothetical protein
MLFLRWYLWVAPHVLLGICGAVLWRQRLYKQFPLFASYIAFQLFEFLTGVTADLLIPAIISLRTYRWIAFGGTGIIGALELGALYELTDYLVFRHSSLAKGFRPFAHWTAALLILIAVGSSALFPQTGSERVIAAFQVLDYSASVVSVGLIVALLLLTRALHLSWSSLPAGIALGLGVHACAELAAAAMLSVPGKIGLVTIDFIRMGAFHVSAILWLVYLFLHERPNSAGQGLQKKDLEFWDKELQKMVR